MKSGRKIINNIKRQHEKMGAKIMKIENKQQWRRNGISENNGGEMAAASAWQ